MATEPNLANFGALPSPTTLYKAFEANDTFFYIRQSEPKRFQNLGASQNKNQLRCSVLT